MASESSFPQALSSSIIIIFFFKIEEFEQEGFGSVRSTNIWFAGRFSVVFEITSMEISTSSWRLRASLPLLLADDGRPGSTELMGGNVIPPIFLSSSLLCPIGGNLADAA